MAKTLTQLIAVVQANLLDPDATYFTTATCTAAIRSALQEFNQSCRNNQGELIDAFTNQYEYNLSSVDSRVVNITNIFLWSPTENHQPLKFKDSMQDSEIYFRLKSPQSDGQIILANYQINFTVDGLDSETDSSIPAYWDNVLTDGATFYACQIRSIARIEKINIASKVAENYIDTKRIYRAAFDKGLSQIQNVHPPEYQPDRSAWEIDDYITH